MDLETFLTILNEFVDDIVTEYVTYINQMRPYQGIEQPIQISMNKP